MTSSAKKKRIVFVSGHLDLTKEEFEAHYVPRLTEAIVSGADFVVGDAPGCDYMTQRFLFGNDARYRVYHMLELPRNNFGRDWQKESADNLVGGFKSDEERDEAMTRASTEDIAWIRPGKKKRRSGTAKNLERRKVVDAELRREERRTWPRFVVGETFGDDGITRFHLQDQKGPDVAHPELAVPIEPGLYERYRKAYDDLRSAQSAFYLVQHRIRGCLVEQEDDPV